MRNLSRTAYPFLLRALSGEGLKESKQEVNLGSVSLSWFKPLAAGNISLSKKTNITGQVQEALATTAPSPHPGNIHLYSIPRAQWLPQHQETWYMCLCTSLNKDGLGDRTLHATIINLQ